MEQEPTVETQMTAYDAVDGNEPIRELEIKALITHYGKLLGKERIVRVAGNLANQLITVVGVETYNDLRGVTFEIYADRCGVILIDAALLVRQFGIPVVPQVDPATVDAIRSQQKTPLSTPSQGAKKGEAKGDGEIYDVKLSGEGIATHDDPLQAPQRDAFRQQLDVTELRSSASQSLGQGPAVAQAGENLQDDTTVSEGSKSTHLTEGAAPSQSQSLQESLA